LGKTNVAGAIYNQVEPFYDLISTAPWWSADDNSSVRIIFATDEDAPDTLLSVS
jgi:hypothetical protein